MSLAPKLRDIVFCQSDEVIDDMRTLTVMKRFLLTITCATFLRPLFGRQFIEAFAPSLKRSKSLHRTKVVTPLHDVKNVDGELSESRRRLLHSGASLPFTAIHNPASAADTTQKSTLLADLPMIRLKLPSGGVGREYVAVKLMIDGKGPFDFMVDTGLTTELITPHLQQTLGLGKGGGPTIRGLGAGGSTQGGQLLKLEGAALCCGKFADPAADTLPLPPLNAIVTNFPQEHIDPAHDPVEGMLGQEILEQYDVDFDFPKGRLRLWEPGTAANEASRSGLVEVPAAILNESLLLGLRMTSTQAGKQAQPIAAIVDCGATFSAVNWAGAQLLGLPPKSDKAAYKNTPAIAAVGVDGRPLYLPLKEIQFTFVGDADPVARTFAPPPPSWKPWNAVYTGIGDLPVFSQILGDGRSPYQGPAAVLGLDVLAQRRVIVEAASERGRRRRLFISPS